MEESAATQYDCLKNTTTARKRRSQTCRRPHIDPNMVLVVSHDRPQLISATSSDDANDDIQFFDSNPRRKQFSLSHCIFQSASLSRCQRENHDSRGGGLSGSFRPFNSENVIAACWKNTNSEGRPDGGLSNGESDYEGKVKTMNLKLGRVTRRMHANGGTGDGSTRKYSRALHDSESWVEQNLQGNSDDSYSPEDKGFDDFCGNSDKGSTAGIKASSMGRTPGKNRKQQGESSGSVRKSKRVPKRRVFNEEFSDEDDDGEIRFLEKLKSRTFVVNTEHQEESGNKKRRPSWTSNGENVGREKSRSGDLDEEEGNGEELVSDIEHENNKFKKRKDSSELPKESQREMTIRTRQRALLHPSSDGSSTIEFPDGLPPAPPRKQKEKLSAAEQQLKKAEAAQRRKILTENAARESEAQAIKKILGQSSGRKKREDKMRKRQEELAQEKAAHERMVETSFIRTVMGPNGTTVTFPKDSLPSIFNSKPSSYPAPREKCAGPSCSNPYKYRDSKTKLPLCSLQCYKAVQAQSPPA